MRKETDHQEVHLLLLHWKENLDKTFTYFRYQDVKYLVINFLLQYIAYTLQGI